MIGNGERKKISVSWVRKAECNGLDHNRTNQYDVLHCCHYDTSSPSTTTLSPNPLTILFS